MRRRDRGAGRVVVAAVRRGDKDVDSAAAAFGLKEKSK